MSQRILADDERLKNRRCGIDNCPSKRYYKVDGRIICDRGHEQNFLETAEDDEGATSLAVQRLRLADEPEVEEVKKRRLEATRRLSPEENALLYLQCYQFILDGQTEALIKLGMPDDLKDIVKMLWGLYITSLDVKLPGPNESSAKPVKEVDDDDDSFSPSPGERAFSDHEESNEENFDDANSRHEAYRSSLQELKKYPALLLSPVFCYLGLLFLRVPVIVHEIYEWIKSEELPYVRAYKLIPSDMFKRLHSYTRSRFFIKTKLEPRDLHYWSAEMAKFFAQNFNITMPPLNHPPILWKFISAMSVPYETYPMAMSICQILELNEFYLGNQVRYAKSGGRVESKILTLVIVACKIGFDLENAPAWKKWAMATDEELEKERLARNDDITSDDILEMSDEKLDQYLDWLQSTWIDEDYDHFDRGKRRIPDSILSMFPLDNLPERQTAVPTQNVATDMLLQLAPSIGHHNRHFTIYRTSNQPSPVVHRLIQRATIVSGLEEGDMTYSVRWIESKLKNWRIRQSSSIREV